MLRKILLTSLFLGGIPAWAVTPGENRKLVAISAPSTNSIAGITDIFQKTRQNGDYVLSKEENVILDKELHRLGLEASIDGNTPLTAQDLTGEIDQEGLEKLKELQLKLTQGSTWGDLLNHLRGLLGENSLQQEFLNWYMIQADNGHLHQGYEAWQKSRDPNKRSESIPTEVRQLSMLGFPLKNLAATPKEFFKGSSEQVQAANKEKFGKALNVFLDHFGHTEASAFEIGADFFQPTFEIGKGQRENYINLRVPKAEDSEQDQYASFPIDKDNDNGSRGFFDLQNQEAQPVQYASPFGFACTTGGNPAVDLIVYRIGKDGNLFFHLMKRPNSGLANTGGMIEEKRPEALEAIKVLNKLLTGNSVGSSQQAQQEFASIRGPMEKIIGAKLSEMFEEIGGLQEGIRNMQDFENLASAWGDFLKPLTNGVTYEVVHAGSSQDPRNTFASYNTTIALAPSGDTFQAFSDYYNGHGAENHESKGKVQLKIVFDDKGQFKLQVKDKDSKGWRDWNEKTDFFAFEGHRRWIENIARNSRQTDSNPNKVTVHVSQASLQAIARNVLSKKADSLSNNKEGSQNLANRVKINATLDSKFPIQSGNTAETNHFTLSRGKDTLFSSNKLPALQMNMQLTDLSKHTASWSRSRKIVTSLAAAAGITGIALVAYDYFSNNNNDDDDDADDNYFSEEDDADNN